MESVFSKLNITVDEAPESNKKVKGTPFTLTGIKTRLLINLKFTLSFVLLPENSKLFCDQAFSEENNKDKIKKIVMFIFNWIFSLINHKNYANLHLFIMEI